MAFNFETFFRLVSYAAVFCGFLALWVSGTFGVVGTAVFVAIMIAAWFLEDSRWQISEKIGTALIVLALPLFYLIWRFQLISLYGSETVIAGILARMILALTAIKLLQKKGDRDWIFLYLMAFFEVLLAAGLSISALYLVTFLAYLLVMVCSIIAFEMRKTARDVETKTAIDKKKEVSAFTSAAVVPARRLPTTSIALIVFIVMLAAPLFFMLPRVGGAGFGGKQGGLDTQTGFSDLVRLGGIGRIQQNNEVVMRVKLEGNSLEQGGLYFRGTALDTFDNQAWSRTRTGTKEPYVRGEREFIQIDQPAGRDSLSIQTIYLEPLDTAVLFALPKAVAVQSNFPLIEKDTYGSLTFRRNYERVSYKVLSDRSLPDPSRLRLDNNGYGPESQNYLQLPESYDKRIFDLAYSIASKEKNRYDRAVAVEKYLQNNLGYTLEQTASGDEPVADFLFNVREGHCEYFATAMAVMLRTQGIATRIVNGFHGGEYNETADMTVVRQSNAHSWVEVYFPKENVWVPFDPTPFAGQNAAASSGIVGQFNKYVEALEAFWIQYFVAFDNQEQRSLVKTLRNGFVDYQARSASYFGHAQDILAEWWKDVRGDKGLQSSLTAIGYAMAYVVGGILGIFLFVWLGRRIAKMKFWRRMLSRVSTRRRDSVVEFYERMQQSLAKKGFSRQPFQTPLEFAFAVGSAEVVSITEKYNRVRFGDEALSPDEADEIEDLLERLEEKETG
ncbi:MAG TPA: DUF3488 and transglutaminase-like domain-containing protein [Pyrinomonadaceae bacterium]|nr:DUF3488 and transglutaminase-like domain-containing protein [Pyrinomonadaceae bacterium]